MDIANDPHNDHRSSADVSLPIPDDLLHMQTVVKQTSDTFKVAGVNASWSRAGVDDANAS